MSKSSKPKLSLKPKVHPLLKTIKPLTNEMFHCYGPTLEIYWDYIINGDSENDIPSPIEHNIINKILKGTLTSSDIKYIEEELIADVECGAVWNYVRIAKQINIDEEIEKTKRDLLKEQESWKKRIN